MRISPKRAVHLAGFLMCITLIFVAGATDNGWVILLALVLIPALGWFSKRQGWL